GRGGTAATGSLRQGQPPALVGGVLHQFLPGDPGRIPVAFVPIRAVSHTVGFHAAHLAERRPHSGEQVRIRHPLARPRPQDHRGGRPAARRRGRIPLPCRPVHRYIKRVVGVPGDVVQYRDKVLTINGERVETVRTGDYYE